MSAALSAGASAADDAACAYTRAWLPRVSRSFALSIAALGRPLEACAGIGYLLCRVVDSIEDDERIEGEVKQALFREFAAALGDPLGRGPALERALRAHLRPCDADGGTAPDDAALCHDAARLFAHYARLPEGALEDLAPPILEMALGMARFQRLRGGGPLVLETWAELADYCHVVAGTVGELLTRLFLRYTAGIDAERCARLRADAEAFGQGLQLVNMAKDLARDAREGRVFVPREAWPEVSAARLVDPAHRSAARGAHRALRERAAGYLEGALRYTSALPAGSPARRFCVLPLLLARATLRRLEEADDALLSGEAIKVSRGEAGALASLVTECASNDDVLARCFERAGQHAVIDTGVA